MIGKAFGVGLLWLTVGLSPASGQTRGQEFSYEKGESNAWTTEEVVRQSSAGGAGGVKKVRVGTHAGYDRVVFEFGLGTPNYWVYYEKPPIEIYGDQIVNVRGRAFIEISLSPILYSEKNYNTPVARIGTGRNPLRTPLISDVWSLGWFEGELMFAVGLNARRPFRVQMLSNPSRLVIDFKK
jgi:hypothetical protein